MTRRVASVLLVAALALGSSGCLVDRFFLFPTKTVKRTPEAKGLAFEPMTFSNARGRKLTAWFIPAKGTRKGSLLLSHGNGGNVGSYLDYPEFLSPAGYDVMLFDYQGYGASEGAARVRALPGDVTAALGALRARKDVDRERVGLYGVSLGTALSVGVARREGPVRAMVLEGSYVPFDMMHRSCGGCCLTWPAAWAVHAYAVPGDVDIEDDLDQLASVPALFITGEADRVTPVRFARRLHARKKGISELWTPPGVDHVPDPVRGRVAAEYKRRVLAFLDAAFTDR